MIIARNYFNRALPSARKNVTAVKNRRERTRFELRAPRDGPEGWKKNISMLLGDFPRAPSPRHDFREKVEREARRRAAIAGKEEIKHREEAAQWREASG